MKHLLILEDDLDFSVLLQKRSEGNYSCECYSSIADYEKYKTNKRPDVVLVDCSLSDGNPFNIMSELKASDLTIPIIALINEHSIIQKSLKHGFSDFYIKGQQNLNQLFNKINILKGLV